MAYATVFHVEQYLPARAPFSANSKPSATAVAAHVEDAQAKVDTLLTKAGYGLPIPTTATIALRELQRTVAICAAKVVESTAPTRDPKILDAISKMCEHACKAIESGELPGVERNDPTAIPRSGFQATSFFSRHMEL